MSNQHVLIVEDEEKLAALERDYLREAGFRVSVECDGGAAVQRILDERPDLVVLDLMLPGEDGLSICRRVRQETDLPIIMVTARVDEIDRLLGLELGADDYLCKPFSPRELVLRVRAILRRAAGGSTGEERFLHYRGVSLDQERHRCLYNAEPVELTPVEFRLLEALLERPGRVLSREQLMTVAYADHRVVSDRTIDSHMRNLRNKLGGSADGEGDSEREGDEDPLVRSVYGVGYALN